MQAEISPPLLEAIHISKTYIRGNKKIPAFKKTSLRVDRGDVYGIIGPSGAGKSSLLRCLAGLLRPDGGQVLFRGKDLADIQKKDLRNFYRKIGMIFQHFHLFHSYTVGENIAYPLRIASVPEEKIRERVDELLETVGLSDKKNLYPSGLSGGEKQRVGIARALANRPELLFCDEATSALDPKTTKEILRLLELLRKKLGITIVLITHSMEVIQQICNKVAVIENGEIIERGTVEKLFSDPQHPTTKYFSEHSFSRLPPDFFGPDMPDHKLLRLKFKGDAAKKTVISDMIKHFDVRINILFGRIDRLRDLLIGRLVIDLEGNPENMQKALDHLSLHTVDYEVIRHE